MINVISSNSLRRSIRTFPLITIVLATLFGCSAFDKRWECRKLISAQRHKPAIFPELEIKQMIARQLKIQTDEVDSFCKRYD